jgi:hypothetical protein
MRNSRKRKAQENRTSQASTSTGPTPTPIIYSYNQPMNTFKRMLLVIHLVMPTVYYVIDYGICMIKTRRRKVAEFADTDVAQLKACATCTETQGRDQVRLYVSLPIHAPASTGLYKRKACGP